MAAPLVTGDARAPARPPGRPRRADPAVPLSAPRLVMQAKQAEIDAARQLSARAELVDVIGQLIHALQRERGATSIYLASQGRRFAGVRTAALGAVRPVEARLRELLGAERAREHGTGARMLWLMAWVLLGLDALEAERSRIGSLEVSAHGSVDLFSGLIAGLVELVFEVADATRVPRASRLLVALLHLVQGKEAAGQERAVGALLFACGTCGDADRQRVVHLIDAQERSLQVFGEFTEPALRERWNQVQLSPGMVRLERLRRTLCAAAPGAALDSDLSDTWFEVCSERLESLWQLQLELVVQLRGECKAQIAEARRQLQDSAGLLRSLREQPPPSLGARSAPGDPAALLDWVQAQSARLARMEAELDAARRALDERKVIERAKGVLMSRLGLSEEAAFRALQKTSMDQNRRLPDVAQATLALPDFVFARPGHQPGR